jgi:hypothetical protein
MGLDLFEDFLMGSFIEIDEMHAGAILEDVPIGLSDDIGKGRLRVIDDHDPCVLRQTKLTRKDVGEIPFQFFMQRVHREGFPGKPIKRVPLGEGEKHPI